MLALSPKYDEVTQTLAKVGTLSKISFIPTVLTYDPESIDLTLKSRDKVMQINAMNRVKVFFHPK